MKSFISKIISIILLCFFTFSLFSQEKFYQEKFYQDDLYVPISNTGSSINGVYYDGIDLSDWKITQHTITGNETSLDFFKNSVSDEYRINWDKVIKKYAIGTSVIVLTGVVSLMTGGTAGYIASGAFLGALEGSVVGAATDALITGTLSALKGNTIEQIFKESVEGSADGFIFGSLTGTVFGGAKVAKDLKKQATVAKSVVTTKTPISQNRFQMDDAFKFKIQESNYRNLNSLQRSIAESSDRYIAKLTLEEQKALTRYTTKAYKSINFDARNSIPNEYVDTLKKVIGNYKLPTEVVSYRGDVSRFGDHVMRMGRNGSWNLPKAGEVITNGGFTSTSLESRLALNMRNESKGIKTLEMIVNPKNSNALYINSTAPVIKQKELLLNVNSRRKILESKILQPGTVLEDGTVIEELTAFVKSVVI